MLLSIVRGGKTGMDPAVNYGTVLQSLKETRFKKITREEKLKVVQDYRAHPEMTTKERAENTALRPRTSPAGRKN